jgi:poly-gamma-glutamate capsule biosynthesis protein CapA/YwtB (metallophosphatase superfamily)
MLGATPTLPPSPETYFDGVRSALRGRVVFANLEGALTDQSAGKCGARTANCFAFRAPPGFARDLRRAGFTVISNANNHSFDFGAAGRRDTVAALHHAGIAQTGLPGEVTVTRAGALRVAFVGFAPYSDTAPLNDPAGAAALIRRADAAADIVVVAIHAGAEGTAALHLTGATETYVGEDRGDPEAFARMAVRAGADLVLGSGPHVLRGMELYRGRLIAYSLGNFAGYHNFSLGGGPRRVRDPARHPARRRRVPLGPHRLRPARGRRPARDRPLRGRRAADRPALPRRSGCPRRAGHRRRPHRLLTPP